MAEVNVALIGYAFMGKAHSNAYRQVSRFFSPRLTPRLKVLCGRTPHHVDRAAKQFGWEETATDWRHVIERRDIHVVDICTPGDSHPEIAIAAAQAGKVVFCEKPLANNTSDAERMLSAVKEAGVNELEVYYESDPPDQRGFRTILVTEPIHPYIRAWWPPGHMIGYEHTFVHTVYELLEAIADGRVPSPDFHDGVANQRVMAAIEQASTTRQWVRVPASS